MNKNLQQTKDKKNKKQIARLIAIKNATLKIISITKNKEHFNESLHGPGHIKFDTFVQALR